jgi:DNA-directed RNA polymerase specialized sigma24 family protein
MTPIFVLLIIFVGISVFGIMTSTLLMLRLRKLARLLELRESAEEGGESSGATGGFSPVLRQANLQARLQQGLQRREMPEKYRFIRSLAEHGVPAAEIAGILNLAPGEVDQLMALASVARRQPLPAAKASRPKKGRRLIKAKDIPPPAETVNSDQ